MTDVVSGNNALIPNRHPRACPDVVCMALEDGLRHWNCLQTACSVTTNGLYCHYKRLVLIVRIACTDTKHDFVRSVR